MTKKVDREDKTVRQLISIEDGDLAQALRELPDGHRQIVLMYYVVGLNDREIGEIFGMVWEIWQCHSYG